MPPSCQGDAPGVSDCGASGESCCTSLPVVGGPFYRTYMNDGGGATGLADPASVHDFRLDKYLVTVGRFRKFVAAWAGGSGWLPAAGAGKHTYLNGGKGLADSANPGGYEPGWVTSDNAAVDPTDANLDVTACNGQVATWTPIAGENERLPIDCIAWQEAAAFCIWDGGFLPSDAEWVYAAAGGAQEREYPWGSTDPGTASQYAIYDCYYGLNVGKPACTGIQNVAAVGTATLGAARWGQLDQEGDMTVWMLDWFASLTMPCVDCADVSSGTKRGVRGIAFEDTLYFFNPLSRRSAAPSVRNAFGVRCARTP
ncbi:MAG TPA: SUMF1/EgtB/PvdO family nonheme iron enzyme [Polyangiaceae bacterium]|nr:SUMF1/EgtB/PvdO family nonheme iron enzyme [Polyangiaceae bacterium]